MAVAAFNYDTWAARYPELAAKVPPSLAASYFEEAALSLDNTDCSPVVNVGQRLVLLNMLVAHIAALNAARADPTLPGRISSATEGSVSISLDMAALPASAAWYAQTSYGLAFWQATAAYRTVHYVPGPQPFLGVPGFRGFDPLWP